MGTFEEDIQQNPFLDILQKPGSAPYTQPQRYARLAMKGASLGLVGSDVQAEGVTEHATEFLGSIPTVAAVSAVATPAIGAATKLAGLAPLGATAARLTSAGVTGALVGGTEAAVKGENIPGGVATGAAQFLGGEGAFIAGGKVLRALRGTKEVPITPATPAQENLAKLTADTTTAVPELPPTRTQLAESLSLPPRDPSLPPSAAFGPNIGAQNKLAPSATVNRVGFDNYVKLADEYGNPINVAPETRFSAPTTALDEYGNPRAIVKAMDPDEYSKMFQVQPDRTLGTQVVVPLKKEADDIVKILMDSPSPRKLEMQFEADQMDFLTRKNGREMIQKLDEIVPKMEQAKTSNVIKLSEEAAQKVIDQPTPVKVIESVVLNKTQDGLLVENLASKNGQTPADLAQILKEAEANVALMALKTAEERKIATKLQVVRLLKERCK